MSWVHPYLLLIMFVPFVIFAGLVLTNRDGVARVFDAVILKRLRVDGDVLPVRVRNTVLLLAVLLMILALGRPVIEHGERTVALRGLEAMVALDISGSMRSRDIYPNRLVFAKRKIDQLLDAMPGDEISLAAFAHAAFMLAPFTTDKAALKQILDGVDESYINLASTNFEALGDLAVTFLEKKKPKILIAVTDGGDPKALASFQSILEEANITLYGILVGTEKGAPVLDRNNRPVTSPQGTIAITQRNDALKTIAQKTGGDAIIAGNGKSDMRHLADMIHAKFNTQKQGNIKVKERTELFVYLLAAATLLLLLGLMSLPKKSIHVSLLFSFFIFHFSFFTPVYAGLTDFKTIQTAQDAYKAKDYNRTIQALTRLRTPSPERNFNLGDAYYKAGRLDEALRTWKRAKGGDVDEEKRLHNIGNVYFKKKQYDHAITAYETALKVHDDPDTRFNLELAKKMKKKQEQKKKQKQKKKQQKKQKKKDKKNKNKKQHNKKNQKNNKKDSKKKLNNKQGEQPKKKPQDKPGDKNKKSENKPGQQGKKKKPEPKKGDKKSKASAKPDKKGQKKKPEKAQGASRAQQQRAQKIRAKEIKRLMKQLKGKKMQPKLYQFVGKKRDTSKNNTINPW